jgi:hypothetical protein
MYLFHLSYILHNFEKIWQTASTLQNLNRANLSLHVYMFLTFFIQRQLLSS